MSVFQAAVLGLIQGLAEFLPVSSSGHLTLAEHFLGLPSGEAMVAFDVLLHTATLVAMLVYFRDDLKRVLGRFVKSLPATVRAGGWARLERDPEAKWGWLVVLTMVPTGITALLLGDWMNGLASSIALVAVMLMVTGGLNWYADRCSRRSGDGRRIEDLTAADALICGVAQSIALVHGISRSGSTIAAGLARGLDKDAAPRFSFLMAIPAIAGAALVELPKLGEGGQVGLAAGLVGFLVALASGYWALQTVFKVVREGRLRGFAYYCWGLGGLALLVELLGH